MSLLAVWQDGSQPLASCILATLLQEVGRVSQVGPGHRRPRHDPGRAGRACVCARVESLSPPWRTRVKITYNSGICHHPLPEGLVNQSQWPVVNHVQAKLCLIWESQIQGQEENPRAVLFT